MRMILIAFVLNLVAIANGHAVQTYPIPAKVLSFYQQVDGHENGNCVGAGVKEDIVLGPIMYFYFLKNDWPESTSGREIVFRDLYLYGQNFRTTYDTVTSGNFETLTVVKYNDACVPRYPFGKGCRPDGVERVIFQVTKDLRNGKIVEAKSTTAYRDENIFGGLKKNWESGSLYNYHCKNGELTVVE